jgi:hypothetical protein
MGKPAPASGPQICDICGNSVDAPRCETCRAAEVMMPTLTHPLLMVDSRCPRWEPVAGAGFVLLDRWRIVVEGWSQFTCRLSEAGPAMAEERAAQWAPGARIVHGYNEFMQALDTDHHWSVSALYDRARRHANDLATYGYQHRPSPLRAAVVSAAAPEPRPAPKLLDRVLRWLR